MYLAAAMPFVLTGILFSVVFARGRTPSPTLQTDLLGGRSAGVVRFWVDWRPHYSVRGA
jgi:hypothetical protein